MRPQRLAQMWKYEDMNASQRDQLVTSLDFAGFQIDCGRIFPKEIPKGYDYDTFGENPRALGILHNHPEDICLILYQPIENATLECWYKVRSICDRIK